MDTCWPSTLCVSILKTVESSNNKISQTGVWFVLEIFVPSSVLPLYQTIICVIVAASMAAFDKRPIRKTVIRIQMRESIEKWFVARYSFELNILINHMRWCVGVLYAHRAHTATHTMRIELQFKCVWDSISFTDDFHFLFPDRSLCGDDHLRS